MLACSVCGCIMPLVGIICKDGRKVSFDECLVSCNNRCIPYPIAYAIISRELESFHVGDKITVTSIIGCVRKTFLERTNNYYNTFANLWFSFRGTALHSSLEILRGDVRWIIEERFEGDVCGIKISGQIDAYDKINRHLIDYKSSKDKSITYIQANGPKKEHQLQVSIYNMLMKQKNLQIDKASIVYLTMEGVFECNDVMLYSNETVEQYVSVYGNILYNAFDSGVVPNIPDPRPNWLCWGGFCPVSDLCEKIND
jgi:hypothetical protein